MSLRELIGGSDTPWLQKEADYIERKATEALTGTVSQFQEWSKPQEGVHDDILRGIGTGMRWVGDTWKAATADQEGIHDDILRGIGGTVGTGLRVLDAASYYGGKVGGNIASMIGFDSRVGGAIGNVTGDLLAGGIIAKAGKVTKATSALRAMTPMQAGEFMLAGPGGVGSYLKQGYLHDLHNVVRKGGSVQDQLITAGKKLNPKFIDGKNVYDISKHGSGTKLKETLFEQLALDPQLAEDLYDGKLNRLVLGEIYSGGDRRRIQGLHAFIHAKDKKAAFKAIAFPSRSSNNAAKLERILRMKPPEDGSILKLMNKIVPDDPKLAKELAEQYVQEAKEGFKQVQEAARLSGLSLEQMKKELLSGKKTKNIEKFLEQWDAGHWRATTSKPHPLMKDKGRWKGASTLGDSPTTGYAARIENRIANQTAKDAIAHDINPFAARKIGVPRTWEEDILMWADRRFNTNKYNNWKELGTTFMDWAEDIPWDMPEAEVERLWRELQKGLIKRSRNSGNEMMAWVEELNLDRISDGLGPLKQQGQSVNIYDQPFVNGNYKIPENAIKSYFD